MPMSALAPVRRPRALAARLWTVTGLLGFAALLTMVLTTEGVAEGDRPVLRWLIDHRTGWLSRALEVVSSPAIAVGVPALAFVGALTVGLVRRRWRPLATLAVAFCGGALLSTGLKLVIGRARPSTASMFGTQASGWSFPSGHTLLTSVLLGALVLLAWPHLRTRARRFLACAGAATAAAVMGLSRLYLGDHWLTDVLASYALAAIVLGATAWLTARTTRGEEQS
ncbi:phosphatase PAP2 family protein [Blastococcus sp. CT_GayMR16]|uniref:phosphatase PAP2 family protein n=1 Tax=Blastococcus sp. CT_GayMR16 TaxID=2559607 RepID=UPI00107333C3|nr:phosphatase PAP2 family protein [Blastococcus sp. CT_GayMR16]TFV91095.1 phosphatase PAP2 family protein [Blastococcus sp. CT_GayMR16]